MTPTRATVITLLTLSFVGLSLFGGSDPPSVQAAVVQAPTPTTVASVSEPIPSPPAADPVSPSGDTPPPVAPAHTQPVAGPTPEPTVTSTAPTSPPVTAPAVAPGPWVPALVGPQAARPVLVNGQPSGGFVCWGAYGGQVPQLEPVCPDGWAGRPPEYPLARAPLGPAPIL